MQVLSSRAYSAAAYDAARGNLLLFGGDDGMQRDDTWSWNGEAWTRVATTLQPSARSGHSMVYDSLRNRVLLFGGSGVAGVLNDLWSWDGTQWSVVAASNPPVVQPQHAMVYDSGRDRVVLWTSWSSSYGQIWEFDGAAAAWQAVAPTVPNWPLWSPLQPMAYDAGTGTTAIYRATGSGSGMWRWDGTSMTRQMATAPNPPRDGAVLVHDPNRNQLLLVSGYQTGSVSSSIVRWNPASGTWTTLSTTGPWTNAHIAVMDPVRDRVVLVGGARSGTPLDSSVWEWDGVHWARRTHAPPAGRSRHAMAYDASTDTAWLFGGTSGGWNPDFWVRSNGDWTFLPTASGAAAPLDAGSDPRLAFHSRRGELLLVAGTASGSGSWKLVGSGWQAVAGPLPPARGAPGLVYDERRERIVMFGGSGPATTVFQDTWAWDGLAWQELATLHSPPPRSSPGIAYDLARDRIVVIGGNTSASWQDTWEFDGVDWALRNTWGAPAVAAPALTYDRARQVVAGWFQVQNAPTGSLWDWDGSQWTVGASATQIGARLDASLIGERNRLLLFGGRNGSIRPASQWQLGTTAPAAVQPFGNSGTSSAGPLQLVGVGVGPWLGVRTVVEFGPLPAIAVPGLWAGVSTTHWGSVTLPTDLGFAGHPSSQLLVSLDVPVPVAPSPTRRASARIDIPNSAGLVGAALHLQAFAFEPWPAELTTSNGLTLTLGVR